MNRRSFLAIASASMAGLAGCPVNQSGGTGDAGTTVPPEARTIATVSVARVGEVPERFPGALSVDLLDSAVSQTEAARIRVSCTNTGDSRREFAFGFRPPFSTMHSSESDPGYLLLRREFFRTADRRLPRGSCWLPDGDGKIIPYATIEQVELDPGERVRQELLLCQNNRNEPGGCMPEGEFRFRSDEYGLDEGSEDDRSEPSRFSWGFSLVVS